MSPLPTRFVVLPLSILALAISGAAALHAESWPSFRGPFARGVADGQDLPTSWSPESGENVRWQAEIPGTAHSSPVVAKGRVYVSTAVTEGTTNLSLGDEGGIASASDGEREFSWRLYAVDAKSGEVAWQREAYAGKPRVSRHVKASQANATPATNGDVVVAIFGSQGMVAYDRSGKELWRKDLGVLDPGLFGDPESQWGHASSPVIHDDLVYVQVDKHADSFVAAYALRTGEERWKVERQEKPVWATPTVHTGSEHDQLIVLGGDFDRGLDLKTGEELWRFARDLQVKTPTPFVAGDLVILSGGYRGKEIHAVPLDSSGVVAESVWTSEPGGPYTSTPVAYDGKLFFVRDTGVFTVLDLKSGEQLHRDRLDGAFSASAIVSDGKIYLAGEDGVVRVHSTEAPFAEIARTDMDAPCMSTPAIADETLYLRCGSGLWAISKGG